MKSLPMIIVYSCLLCCFFYDAAYSQANDKATKPADNNPDSQIRKRQIKIQKGQLFLNFPVTESSPLKKTRILADGKVIDEFTINLSGSEPDYWTFFDVSGYQGKTITIESENSDQKQNGFEKIYADSRFPGQEHLYNEKMRPQVHFSSRRGWHNDPNGLVYDKGEYHLYYQHNPHSTKWGNMHWGHAVSNDLLHWNELADALYTPSHGDMAFSGSAIIDTGNTAGFRKNGIDPLIAVFTSTGRGECLALSYDRGRTFKDYDGNPVVKHKGRDPKVFWYQPGAHWVMVVYDESHIRDIGLGLKSMNFELSIYNSPDLKNWTYQSSIPGFFECPELFQLEVEGEPGNKKWVIYAADGKYKIGGFDGKEFTVEQDLKTYDYGGAFYASQTYNNIPANDGRRIQVGWARIQIDSMPFNQCMTFPAELTLRKSFDGYRLCPTPVREINKLYKNSKVYKDIVLDKNNGSFSSPVNMDVFHVVAEFKQGDSRDFGLNINGFELTYNNLFNEVNKINYPLFPNGDIKIEAIVDKAIIEIFINDGELYFVKSLNSVTAEKLIKVFANGFEDGRKMILKKLEVNELTSVWKEKMVN
jgi:fructan beta-fructosidase